MPELFPQQLKANFTPDQQEYYSQLENELKEILGNHTQEEIVAGGDPEIIKRVLAKKQDMLNFVLTKKTREMMKQEDKEQEARMLRQSEEQLEKERQAVSFERIAKKHFMGQELSDIELKYLYNIDDLGLAVSSTDKERERVKFIIGQRNIKKDVARAFGCDEDQVSLTKEEFLSGHDICYHFGDLELSLDEFDLTEEVNLPQYVNGDFHLSKLSKGVNLKFPEYVGGKFELAGLSDAQNLELPRKIAGVLMLDDWRTVQGIKWPEEIQSNIILSNLINGEGLEIPHGTKDVLFLRMSDSEISKLKSRFPDVSFVKI